MSEELREYARPVKSAQGDSEIQEEALNNIGRYLALSLGTGAAVRGGQGLYNLYHRETEEEEDDPTYATLPVPSGEKMGFLGSLTQPWGDDPGSIPAYYPALAAATGGGLYGGYKGLDALLGSQQERGEENELEQAREEFEQALLEAQQRGEKQGAGSELGQELDNLFEAVKEAGVLEQFQRQKQAGFWDYIPFGDTLQEGAGKGLGMYGLYAMPAAALAGHWAYQNAQDTSEKDLVEKARQLQERANYNQRPFPLRLDPRAISPDKDDEEERQEQEEPTLG